MSNLIDDDAKVITPGNYGYGHPTVVSFDDGTLFAGHINDTGNLEIHKSINNGSSWTLDKTITPSIGSIIYFSLCYRKDGSNNELFVLYNDGTAKYYVEKRNNAGSWSQVLDLTTNNKKALLRWDEDIDRLQLVYSLGSAIKTNYSDNGGSNWTTGVGYGVSTVADDFDINPIDNTIWISQIKTSGTSTYGVLKLSSIGAYITDSTIYGSADAVNKYSQLLVNSAGNITRIYYKSDSTDIKIYGVGVDTWSVTIDSLMAGMDGDDNIYVFYTKTSDEKVYYRKYDGSWGSETLLVDSANNKFNCEKHSIPSSIVLNYMYYTA